MDSLYYEFGLKAEYVGSLFNQNELKDKRNSMEIQLSLKYESEAERLAGWGFRFGSKLGIKMKHIFTLYI